MKNLKIRPGYKTLATILLFGLAGCKKFEHKNVITGIGAIENQKVLLLDDVETGIERIYNVPKTCDFYDWLQLGDTVIIYVGPSVYPGLEKYYQKDRILDESFARLRYNTDSIYARKQRKKFSDMKQKMYDEKSK